ncbi:MAG: hypothetical protein AUK44_04840 [Porphyromonadaceae bacterium CG2_30_38_12]|nr:MAG: hypothetical protein AUK44_04840 [Porphyromonadaceae bacterium CG2_30_38_12]
MKTKKLLLIQACIMLFAFTAMSQTIAPGDSLRINFQPAPGNQPGGSTYAGAALPTGYLGDFGNTLANHNGLTYGWNSSFTSQGRQRLDPAGTGANNPWGNCIQFNRPGSNGVWTIHLKPGYYDVRIVAGDASYTDSKNSFYVNGLLLSDLTPANSNFDDLKIAGVEVKADSILSFTSSDANNNAKVCFIVIANGVYVPHETIHVASVKIDPSNFALFVGKSATLKAKVLPLDAADKSVVWASDNAAITVGATTGTISAVSIGTANVTATSTDGSIVGTCTVRAIDPAASTGTNPNLILNPGFEDDLQWWSNWTGHTATSDPADVASGYKASFILDGLAGGCAQDITLPAGGAGKTYIFKVKAKTTGLPTAAQSGCKLMEGTVELNSPYYFTVENADTPYTEYVFAVATTAATTKAQIWVWKNAPGSIYLDDYSFAEVDFTSNGVNTISEVKTSCFLNSNNLTVKNNAGLQSVSIFNVNGQSVLNKAVNSNESNLNVSNLSNGIYIVKATLNSGKSEFIKVQK